LAYFIFYYYLKFHSTLTSSRGQILQNSENANAFNPDQALGNAWNFGLDLYGETTDELVQPTAYNFLYNFKDDAINGYDGWIFTPISRFNTFGI
jgi:hypothetical protein